MDMTAIAKRIIVIASQRIGAISAFTRVFDALWRRPMTGSAKQSGRASRAEGWIASERALLAMTQLISAGFAGERSKELSWIR
ncbi:MAG: hypothetical protein J0G95_01265 [Rhizobiales bacterium]|nr:hypothetical protein [Hyphomicrobiales bacterium]